MNQEANEWTTLLRRANQLFRATTHPAVVQLPVEATMPALGGATEWLNSPPLTAADLRGKVVLVTAAANVSETNGSMHSAYLRGNSPPAGNGVRREVGICECSGAHAESKPRSSRARANAPASIA